MVLVTLESQTDMDAFDLGVTFEPGRLYELTAQAAAETGYPLDAGWQFTFTNQKP